MSSRTRILVAVALAIAAVTPVPQAASADSGPCNVDTGKRLVQPSDPNGGA